MSASADDGNQADSSGPQLAELRVAIDRLADGVGQLERQFGGEPSIIVPEQEMSILLTPIAPSFGKSAGVSGGRAVTGYVRSCWDEWRRSAENGTPCDSACEFP